MLRLDPLNDFMFKKLFGEQQDKDFLIGLLNAILDVDIKDVIIENELLQSETLKEKQAILDIKASTENEKINIEVQLNNQRNMDRRTLFYWSRLYCENFKKGESYKDLKRTITINLLDFNMEEIKDPYFHTTYQLMEKTSKNILTDLMELHFIEFKKIEITKMDLRNPLHRWLLFLKKSTDNSIIEEVIRMDETIKRANEKFVYISSDSEAQELYRIREKAMLDEINRYDSAVSEGIEKGIELGIEQGIEQGMLNQKYEVLNKLLLNGMEDMKFISEVTGLNEGQILEWKNKNSTGN